MAIINYYEKYGISQTDELHNIQWVINQKLTDEENDSFGEGHADKMLILQSAKEAFASEESKKKYDQELADSMKKSDPDGERKIAFEKWYNDAKTYYANQQYDLAKTAIEMSFQYTSTENADYIFYAFAADIYSLTANFTQAIDYANQSIVHSPDNYYGYFTKMVALDRYMFSNNLSTDVMMDIWKQLCTTIDLMTGKAIATGNNSEAARGYSLFAKMYYLYVNGYGYPISGKDNALAEKYAVKAVSLIKDGQEVSIAKKILEDINTRRTQIAKYQSENSVIEQQNSSLRDKISSLKASIRNATSFGNTTFGGAAGIGTIAAIIGLILMSCHQNQVGLTAIAVSIATFSIKGGIVAKNKRIRDTLQLIKQCESEIKENILLIDKNENIISLQSKGLAPHPISME